MEAIRAAVSLEQLLMIASFDEGAAIAEATCFVHLANETVIRQFDLQMSRILATRGIRDALPDWPWRDLPQRIFELDWKESESGGDNGASHVNGSDAGPIEFNGTNPPIYFNADPLQFKVGSPPPSAEADLPIKEDPPKPDLEPEPQPTPPAPAPTWITAQEFLSDQPIAVSDEDCLGLDRIATSLANFLHHEGTKTPCVIAINAEWGAGKTSLTNLIESKLERPSIGEVLFNRPIKLSKRPFFVDLRQRLLDCPDGSSLRNWGEAIRKARSPSKIQRHTICHFNAWNYDDSPNLTATFAQIVTREANKSRFILAQIFRPTAFRQSTWLVRLLTIGVGAAIFVLLTQRAEHLYATSAFFQENVDDLVGSFAPLQKLRDAANGLTVPALFAASIPLWSQFRNWFDSLNKFINDPAKVASRGQISKVREGLGKLLQQATSGRRRFVIVIDDLERCKAENALAILDLVNQLLGHPNVVVLICGDMDMIAASAGSKFKEQAKLLGDDLEERIACLKYGRRYLQKVVQMQFDLPPPASADLTTLIRPAPPEPEPGKKGLAVRVLQGIWVGITSVSAFADLIGRLVLRATSARRAKQIDQHAEAMILADTLPSNLSVQELLNRFKEAGVIDDDAIQQSIQATQQRYDATAEAIGYLVRECLPITPRQLKRYENALRVLYQVLSSNGISLDGGRPQQLAKWLVLQDRWPTVAARIRRQPAFLAQLEDALATYGPDVLKANFPEVSDQARLAKHLALEPSLGDIAGLLVNLRGDVPADEANTTEGDHHITHA